MVLPSSRCSYPPGLRRRSMRRKNFEVPGALRNCALEAVPAPGDALVPRAAAAAELPVTSCGGVGEPESAATTSAGDEFVGEELAKVSAGGLLSGAVRSASSFGALSATVGEAGSEKYSLVSTAVRGWTDSSTGMTALGTASGSASMNEPESNSSAAKTSAASSYSESTSGLLEANKDILPDSPSPTSRASSRSSELPIGMVDPDSDEASSEGSGYLAKDSPGRGERVTRASLPSFEAGGGATSDETEVGGAAGDREVGGFPS